MKNFAYFLVFITIVSTCKHAIASCKEINSLHDANCYLLLKDSVVFHLDSITTPYINYIQFFHYDDRDVLSFLNGYDNSIYLYDYNSKQLINKIYFTDFGINTPIQGYCVDKYIYAYSYDDGRLYVADPINNVMLKKYVMYKEPKSIEDITYPYPFISTLTPIFKRDSAIFSIGYRSGESRMDNDYNRPVLIKLDLNNGKVSNYVNYPSVYKKYDWGGTMCYRLPFYLINDNDEFIISFPAYHGLIRGNIKDCYNLEYIEHSSQKVEINPYKKIKRYIHRSSSDVWSWYMKNYSYEGIVYDKYRRLYYRILRSPLITYQTGDIGNFKPISIIVFDSDMNYNGTYVLPEDIKFRPFNIFVSPQGLNIQVLSDNEDVLKYYVYEYSK